KETMPMGMLIKKIQRQLQLSVIQPPSGGPMTGAGAVAMLERAKAARGVCGGKVSTRIACSRRARAPPPDPCVTRKKVKRDSEGAKPQSSELTVKRKTQAM